MAISGPRARLIAATSIAVLVLMTGACGSDGVSPEQEQREQQRAATTTEAPTTTATPSPSPTVARSTLSDALSRAIASEREARARYTADIDALGPIAPFTNILAAEEQHVAAVEALAAARNIPLPADTSARPEAPTSRAQACRAGVTSEQEVIALYAELLPIVAGDAEATRVFTNLRDVSRDRHLPAFERCS